MSEALHIVLHSLEESLKVFVVALILYFIISFVEEKIAQGLGKKNRSSERRSTYMATLRDRVV